jgi:DNA adenine methylase
VNKNLNAELKAKPFLKWAGGKGQLLDEFVRFYPNELKNLEINQFYEPFIGGGAVFFDVVQRYNIKSAIICDINKELILTYKVVRKDVTGLIQHLEKYQKQYEKLDDQKQAEYFYTVRKDFNYQCGSTNFNRYSKKWIARAAQTIFLNRTCFNGLFRFNSKGEFNVPQGRYKNPKILDAQNLQKVSEILQIAEIKQADFKEVEKNIKENSFVYFDPPYRPISKTSGFTSYSTNPFGDEQQIELSELFHRLDKKGLKLMLSNSDPKNTDPGDDFFDKIYKGHHIFRVPAKRIINSNAAKRHNVNEIVVTNYPVV